MPGCGSWLLEGEVSGDEVAQIFLMGFVDFAQKGLTRKPLKIKEQKIITFLISPKKQCLRYF
jgi:hypothetical protein